MSKLKYIIEYILVIVLFTILRIIPWRIRVKTGGFLGLVVYLIFKKRRDIALMNIASSFPDKSSEWHKQICKQSFINLGKNAMEFIHLSGKGFNGRFIEKYISFEGGDLLREALEKGRGIVGICPHLGSWEFLAAYTSSAGYNLSVIMKRQSNPYVDRLIADTRSKYNIGLIYKIGAGMPVLRALKKNSIVGFVADQDAGKSGIFIDFMGKQASTVTGPARFALAYRSPVLLFIGVRESNDRFRIIIDKVPGYEKVDHEKEKTDDNVSEITQLWNSAIEYYIRKYPEQYFWMHRRWKTQPIDE